MIGRIVLPLLLMPLASGTASLYTLHVAAEPVELTRNGNHVDVQIGGRPFTTYYFDPSVAKPYFFPLRSAHGTVVTRGFPITSDIARRAKDVYVEKPCSHNLWEGPQLVRAAEKYKRIVQHGTQSRSARALMEAITHLHKGTFGEIYLARGLCLKRRDTIGRAPAEPVPQGVDYDLWTGPAPSKPRNRFHYNWHWIWETGNGDLGNQGVHQLDAARWGLGVGFPRRVSAVGGHFMFDDDQETPNTLNCAFEFDQAGGRRKMMEFEVRHWITNDEAGLGHGLFSRHNAIGNVFYGSNGYLAAGNEDAFSYESWIGPDQKAGPRGRSGSDHFANFISCVRSRETEKLNAPIEEGHITCALVHLANASYRLGRALRFDPETEQVVGNEEANRLLSEKDRGYRAPFLVPDEV